MRHVVLICLWSVLSSAAPLNSTTTQKPTYRAAVLEFAPKRVPDPSYPDSFKLSNSLSNLQSIEPFIQQAAAQGSQIVVIPEYGVTGAGFQQNDQRFNRQQARGFCENVPGPSPNTLCTDPSASVVSALACLAQRHHIVLVANLLTQVPCDPTLSSLNSSATCKDGRYQYNTAVAFDESGALIAKYYKRHLYGHEKQSLDPGTAPPRDSTFSTSFGVEFGMFVCFDILYEDLPSKNIHSWAYPTEWVNSGVVHPPAVVVQRMWSLTHRKVLLAANYGGFGKKSSGSGIWSSGVAKAEFVNKNADPESKLLVADVPMN